MNKERSGVENLQKKSSLNGGGQLCDQLTRGIHAPTTSVTMMRNEEEDDQSHDCDNIIMMTRSCHDPHPIRPGNSKTFFL